MTSITRLYEAGFTGASREFAVWIADERGPVIQLVSALTPAAAEKTVRDSGRWGEVEIKAFDCTTPGGRANLGEALYNNMHPDSLVRLKFERMR